MPMITRIYTSQIKDHIGASVTVAGFVKTIRDQGNIKFLVVRDITGIIQIVVTKNNQDALLAASQLSTESVVAITGLAKKEQQAPGGLEIAAETIRVLSRAHPELPIPIVEKGNSGRSEEHTSELQS